MPRRALLAVLVLLAVPSTAAAAPRITFWQGTIDLAGYSTATTVYDSTATCAPGEAWTGKQEATFETGRPLPIRINIVGRQIASEPVQTKGSAVSITTEIANYRSTENCDRPTDESAYIRPAQHCPAKISGRLILGIHQAPRVKNAVADDLDDLEPLSQPAGLLLNRFSGPWPDANACPGFEPISPRAGDARAGTMAFTGTNGIDLPLNGIGTTELRHMRIGRTLKSEVRAGGACKTFLVNPKVLAVAANFVEDCTLSTRIVVTLKRTG